MSTAADTPDRPSQTLDLIDFRLFERQEDGQVYEGIYGVSVAKVREIIVLPKLSRLPDAHPAVAGIFNLRGVHVPAVRLARWLKLDEAPPEETTPKVIVCELGQESLGLIVHQTSRIRTVPWAKIFPPPPLVTRRHGAAINGTTQIDDEQTMLLIDVEQIVAEVQQADGPPEIGDVPASARGGTILTVDDSAVARIHVRRALESAGYRVIEATNGREALERLAAGDLQVDAVVTDAEMPLLNGQELVRALRADPRFADLRLLMHSSLAGGSHAEAARAAGADDYVLKFDAPTLVGAVNRLLA